MIKLIPTTIGVFAGKFYPADPVTRIEAFPPGTHPAHCPLIKDCHALRITTVHGGRWMGVQNATINASLRMEVTLLPGQERDEVIAKWENPE